MSDLTPEERATVIASTFARLCQLAYRQNTELSSISSFPVEELAQAIVTSRICDAKMHSSFAVTDEEWSKIEANELRHIRIRLSVSGPTQPILAELVQDLLAPTTLGQKTTVPNRNVAQLHDINIGQPHPVYPGLIEDKLAASVELAVKTFSRPESEMVFRYIYIPESTRESELALTLCTPDDEVLGVLVWSSDKKQWVTRVVCCPMPDRKNQQEPNKE